MSYEGLVKELIEVVQLIENLKHSNAEMAGDFNAIAAELNRADIPHAQDVRSRVTLLVDAYLELRNDN